VFPLRRILFITLCLFGLTASDVGAHELWLSPQRFVVDEGAEILADIRIGEKFRGAAREHRAQNIQRLELYTQSGMSTIRGKDGDEPALQITKAPRGLAILVYVTRPEYVTYHDWDQFKAFVEHKNSDWVLARHKFNRWSTWRFSERYTRFAKSFIAVGKGTGRDRAIGLELEIVAEKNPYVDDISGGLPVRVLYQGEPRSDAQVEIFAKNDSDRVTVTTTRTDASGFANIPVKPATEYLLDSVVIREANGEPVNGVRWESLWASLTFRTP